MVVRCSRVQRRTLRPQLDWLLELDAPSLVHTVGDDSQPDAHQPLVLKTASRAATLTLPRARARRAVYAHTASTAAILVVVGYEGLLPCSRAIVTAWGRGAACMSGTMRFLFIRKNRPIFIGNLGLFWIHLYGLIGNA